MSDVLVNTQTAFANYARIIKKANEDLQNVKKYLDSSSPNYYPTYIAKLREIKASANPPADIDTKIATAETNYATYQATENKARTDITAAEPLMRSCVNAGDYWAAQPAKVDEFLYILDKESCESKCIDWLAIAATCNKPGWGSVLPTTAGCPPYSFKSRSVTYSSATQTDAVRIWNNNCVLDGLTITDNRVYTDAHRDAIQLIPPPQYKSVTDSAGKVTLQKLADQMAGTILDSSTVKNCVVKGSYSPLQGIFMSDGLAKNLLVTGNDVMVRGAHAISLAGVLSGSITNNKVREVSDSKGVVTPRIRLFPLRIGGNMADDGVICILNFATGTSVSYNTVTTSNNTLIKADGTSQAINVEDFRNQLPDEFLKIGAGLSNFNYDNYFAQYSSWTVQDFKTKDSWGYNQMVAWLNLRIQEYSSGTREAGSPLPAPSSEQSTTVLPFLRAAKSAIDGNTSAFLNTRLADLQETAIRSFAMKRIAVKNGTVVTLFNLGATINPRRQAMLKWVLESNNFNNMVATLGDIDIIINDKDLGIPLVGEPYTLTLSTDSTKNYTGITDESGRIYVPNIPFGDYLLSFENQEYLFVD
jgi:hypothetical protein